MADIYTVPEITWNAGNLSLGNFNTYLRDNIQALRAGLTDSSADSDIWQSIKFGTLAARPTPSALMTGRQYYATDIGQTFIWDGTSWQHITGSGVWDSFDRANVEPMNAAPSGHAWTEVGDIDISSNFALPQAANALMTVDTGAPLRTAHYGMMFQVGNTVANLDCSLLLRYVDANNFLRVRLNGAAAAMQIQNRIATVDGALDSTPITYGVSNFYFVEVFVRGPVVRATIALEAGGGLVSLEHSLITDTYSSGGFATATRTGIAFGANVGAGNQWVNDFFCIPNA